MKTTLVVLVMIVLSATSIEAQVTKDKVWVPIWDKQLPIPEMFFKYNIPIYEIKVSDEYYSTAEQNNGVIFGRDNNRVFLNTNKWNYNFTDKADGGKGLKLSKLKPDSLKFRHPDFSQLGGLPFYLICIEKNVGSKVKANVQALVDVGDYALLTKHESHAKKFYRDKAKRGDKHSMYVLACLLEKGSESEQKAAFELFSQLSKSGDKRAYCHLSNFYDEGKIVPKNDTKAEQLILFSEQDHISARSLASQIINYRPQQITFSHDEVMAKESQRDRLYSLIITGDEYYINKVLKKLYTTEEIYGTHELRNTDDFEKAVIEPGRNPDYPFSDDYPTKFFDSVNRLLKCDECDWMWVYIPMRYLYRKVFTGETSDQSVCNIIEHWCDIALKTRDVELLNWLCERIWSPFDLGVGTMSYYTIPGKSILQENYQYCYFYRDGEKKIRRNVNVFKSSNNKRTLKNFVDNTVLNKAKLVLKRGAEMGTEKWVKLYEKEVLSK